MSITLRCANMLAPGSATHLPSGRRHFRCARFFTPGSPEHQQNALQLSRRLTGARICSHLEVQLTSLQADDILGAQGFSHLEVLNTNRTLCN